ncbi:hypothetical protein D3C71_679160 [compost metagenome]
MMPSVSRLVSGPAGSTLAASSPSQAKPASMPSISGVAQANTAWKIRNITTTRVIKPNTGCSSQRSSVSSIFAVRAGIRTAADRIARTCAW